MWEIVLHEEVIELVERAQSRVKTVNGARILVNDILTRFDPFEVQTVDMGNFIYICLLEALSRSARKGCLRLYRKVLFLTHGEEIFWTKFIYL